MSGGKFLLGKETVNAFFLEEGGHGYVDKGRGPIPGPIWIVENGGHSYAVPPDVFMENFEPLDVYAYEELNYAGVDLSESKQNLIESIKG